MELNKKYSIGTVVIVSVVTIVYFVGISLYYEIGGSIVVNDPDFEIKEYVDCNYSMDGLLEEKVVCKRIKDGISFKSHSAAQDLYI